MNVLILGASYGSLLSTKLLMAGHDVTLVCRDVTAGLINEEGTQVRIKLRDEPEHRVIDSKDLPGKVDALTPDNVKPQDFDLVALAMQEPQYSSGPVKELMARIAAAKVPCLSIMNMPPRPYLARIPSLSSANLDACYDDPSVWDGFEPGLISLCSPDPQAFRPPEEKANFLHVGLPTNFKAAVFESEQHNIMLRQLETDIANVTLGGKDVPVKLRVFDSLFVPMAKWSMLLTGNYRCVTPSSVRPIRDAVHSNLDDSSGMYAWVDALAQKLGADVADLVPFEKYAKAAENLLKPSSVARAIDGGSSSIERVDKLVQIVGAELGIQSAAVDDVVRIVDDRIAQNKSA
ncbi:MAG: ketopantoate reductase family protein [Granulosicoccus sp.]